MTCTRRAQATIQLGAIVRRGPTWKWGDQDLDSSGAQVDGVVIGIPQSRDGSLVWVDVRWDTGKANGYRMGVDQKKLINYQDLVVVPPPKSYACLRSR